MFLLFPFCEAVTERLPWPTHGRSIIIIIIIGSTAYYRPWPPQLCFEKYSPCWY
jgi:hypothetical protein